MDKIDNIKEIWQSKAKSIGYTAAATLLSSLYPADFEAYMIAFELCDNAGETLDFFSFPIMPSQLEIQETIPVRVENTFGGVNALSSTVYVPKDITLNGNFGRIFKVLVRNEWKIPVVTKFDLERDYSGGEQSFQQSEISHNLKTGYGCIQVLRSLINRSVAVDPKTGMPNQLYMYNMAFGEGYLVKPTNFNTSQDISTNGIWKYNLSLKTICPLYITSKSLQRGLMSSAVQISLNTLVDGLRDTVRAVGGNIWF